MGKKTLKLQEAIEAAIEKFEEFLRLTREPGSYRDVQIRGLGSKPAEAVYCFRFSYKEPVPLVGVSEQQIAIKRALGSSIEARGQEWVEWANRKADVHLSSTGELLSIEEP